MIYRPHKKRNLYRTGMINSNRDVPNTATE